MTKENKERKPRTTNPINEATREMARIAVLVAAKRKRLEAAKADLTALEADITALTTAYAESEKRYNDLRPKL